MHHSEIPIASLQATQNTSIPVKLKFTDSELGSKFEHQPRKFFSQDHITCHRHYMKKIVTSSNFNQCKKKIQGLRQVCKQIRTKGSTFRMQKLTFFIHNSA